MSDETIQTGKNQIRWLELPIKKLSDASAFYTNVFTGMVLQPYPSAPGGSTIGYIIPHEDCQSIPVFMYEAGDDYIAPDTATCMYVYTDLDLALLKNRVLNNGGQLINGSPIFPHPVTGQQCIKVKDNSGNVIGIAQI
ncbi:MAG: hypothetical protein WC313_07285 [Candidatus Kapaibacterium sp.]